MILFTCKLARKYVILRAFYFNRGKNNLTKVEGAEYMRVFYTKQVAKILRE